MQGKLRQLEVTIENELVTNQNLKNVKNVEENMRMDRDENEKEMLQIGSETQNDSIKMGKNFKSQFDDQDKKINKYHADLK